MASRSGTFLKAICMPTSFPDTRNWLLAPARRSTWARKRERRFRTLPCSDGFELKFGKASIRVLETPGHTPESICLVVTDSEEISRAMGGSDRGHAVHWRCRPPRSLSGHTPAQLAGLLYDSLHQKLLALPDNVLVYPAHGAGSLCGKNMRAERSSTIGTERLTNYALQIKSREEFVAQLTSNLPARPEYFLKDAEINRTAPPPCRTCLLCGRFAVGVENDVEGWRDRARRASWGRVRCRPRARLGEHCAVGPVCLVGGHGAGIVSASRADCGIGFAVGRGSPQAGARRH